MEPTPHDQCEVTLTETNSHGYIAICTCGWTGVVHPSPTTKKRKRDDKTVDALDYHIGKEAALTEWRAHRDAGWLRQHTPTTQGEAA